MSSGHTYANLVRAMDVNPLEGLPSNILKKLMADISDKSVEPPTEEELQIIESHAKKSADRTREIMVQMLADRPQAVHTLEQATGLTPIMIACQSGNVSHVRILMKAMKEWKQKRETEEWAKEDAAAAQADSLGLGGGDNSNNNQKINNDYSARNCYKYRFRNPTINRHDATGYAPIHHCVYSGNVEVLAALLGEEEEGEREGNEENGETTTHEKDEHGVEACSSSSSNKNGCVDVNLSTVYVPSMKPTGETPLHIAVRLVGSGGTPHITESDRSASASTPPTRGDDHPDVAIVRLLLKHGAAASINARDDRGRTPLGQIKTPDGTPPSGGPVALVTALLESLGAVV